MGYGSARGETGEAGLRQLLSLIEREGLLEWKQDGRLQPRLAESLTSTSDRLRWRVHLRTGVRFHNGEPLTANGLSGFLQKRLPAYLGPLWDDVAEIRVLSPEDLEFVLKRPSALFVEGLDMPIESPESRSGTGPYYVATSSSNEASLNAHRRYYGGAPLIDRIVIRPYDSVRAAWADMLRGDVDMLFEVGIDALDSLRPARNVRIFTQQRNYAYVVLLNVHKPGLRESAVRRQLNESIDRDALVTEGLRGHGRPANGPMWPWHWANDASLPAFSYRPVPLERPLVLRCLFADSSLERLAIAMQKQLAAIGVDLKLELTPLDNWFARVQSGNFDAVLADAVAAPTLLYPYLFWHTNGLHNWGKFSSPAVDAALDTIRHSTNDESYKAGVAAFQRAMIDDPPAIFLAWSERSRAVSTRFEVKVEPGRDILSTLRLWRPVGDPYAASQN